jgi:hypothetical protein
LGDAHFFNSHWMNTMYRCLPGAARAAARGLALAVAVSAAVITALPAQAQMTRNFPAVALRGVIAFTDPPVITLNKVAAQLAPGVRIRGTNNGLLLQGALTGQTLTVHYTQEFSGLINQVWLLTDEELARKPWPRTLEEAQSWSFDAGTQTWTKP